MKKVIALILALMVCMSFAACRTKTADNSSDAQKYIIYSDNAFAPFEYLDDETGKYTGVDMEILAAIAKDQGFEYEMHNEGFKAAMGAVQSGQADAMIAGMTINDERKETFDFSEGYFPTVRFLQLPKTATLLPKRI